MIKKVSMVVLVDNDIANFVKTVATVGAQTRAAATNELQPRLEFPCSGDSLRMTFEWDDGCEQKDSAE